MRWCDSKSKGRDSDISILYNNNKNLLSICRKREKGKKRREM
jgi:hypothetical protein